MASSVPWKGLESLELKFFGNFRIILDTVRLMRGTPFDTMQNPKNTWDSPYITGNWKMVQSLAENCEMVYIWTDSWESMQHPHIYRLSLIQLGGNKEGEEPRCPPSTAVFWRTGSPLSRLPGIAAVPNASVTTGATLHQFRFHNSLIPRDSSSYTQSLNLGNGSIPVDWKLTVRER